MLFPFWLALINAFKPSTEYIADGPIGVPTQLDFTAIIDFWIGVNFNQKLLNSVILSGSVALIAATLSLLSAFAIGIGRIKGKVWILAVFMLAFTIPQEALVYPLFVLSRELNLYDSLLGVTIILAVLQSAFGTYMLASVLGSFPMEVLEAARLDGASRFQILRLIVLPLTRSTSGRAGDVLLHLDLERLLPSSGPAAIGFQPDSFRVPGRAQRTVHQRPHRLGRGFHGRHPASPDLLPSLPAHPDARRKHRSHQVTTLQPALRHPSLRSNDQWWKAAVVYQVYPRSFADSNGDGIGDIRGIINRLDHLEDLGIDVVWLSPVYASPQDDNGYDISDYYAVDPTFGTLQDLDELIAELHARGMKLVMDLVVNHTSDEHAWFQESAASRSSAKRDWYIWRDPREGAEPNNWGSFFSGSAWELDQNTGQYFLHLFSRKQPDLNWDNPEVRAAVYQMMNWWLDRGIDGFRMDVISFISKHPDLPDGPVSNGGSWGNGIPFYGSGPRVHEYLQEMHREVFAHRDADLMTVGEMVDATPELARLYTDQARRELDMVFHFEHVGLDHGPGGKFTRKPLDLVAVKHSFARWQEALADVGWNSLYWNNHDQPRAVSRFGNDTDYWYESATALATVLHLMRGTPYIYQGEELGMTNMPFSSIDDFRDLESLNYYREAVAGSDGSKAAELLAGIAVGGRDNARTPVQWDATPNAGFTKASRGSL
jgi:oligo-1,6-glucosidase